MHSDGNRLRRASRDYARVEEAICYLAENFREQPDLEKLSRVTGLSPYHFQRLFSRWVGTSPKRFLQYLTAEYAKRRLRDCATLMEAAWDAGLSGSSRLHDLMVTVEAVTPGEFKRYGRDLEIRWGIHPTPFGDSLLGTTERGLCALEFLGERSPRQARDELAARWPGATLVERPRQTHGILERLFPASGRSPRGPFTLLVKGTNFQLRVWQALLRIPPGALTSYGAIARRVERPDAARAVGQAVGSNPISYLIPCHRVISSVAGFGGYRWGLPRKRAMLAWEAAHASEATAASAAASRRPAARRPTP